MQTKFRTKIVLILTIALAAGVMSVQASRQSIGDAAGKAVAAMLQQGHTAVASHSVVSSKTATLEPTTTTMVAGSNPVRYGLGITITGTVTAPPSAYGKP